MINLLINDSSMNNSPKNNLLDETSFGGLPVQQIGQHVEWPTCTTCEAQLQYQGKIKTDLGLELIFMCNNDPGGCDEWDAEGGGNRVIVVDGDQLEFFKPIDEELSLRAVEYGVTIAEVEAEDYDAARKNWSGEKRDILGQLYGEPSWIQGDETPDCDCCSKPMRFVAELEEGPDHKTAMNFGGCGVGYLFDCAIGKTAKFLWQC